VGLDPRQIIEIRELIKALAQDHTVILSTHILPEVSMTCSRVVIINRGRLVALDTPVHLTEEVGGPEHVVVQVRGPRDAVEAAIKGLPGVESATVQSDMPGITGLTTVDIQTAANANLRPRLAQAIVGKGWDLLEMRPVSLSLEDVFLRVTSAEEPQVEPEEAELYMQGEGEAYEDQEIEAAEEANAMAAEAEAEAEAIAATEADVEPEQELPRSRKKGRR